jgi:hypothetical protein
MINLVELTLKNKDKYLVNQLKNNEFECEEFIIGINTIGIRNGTYNNNFAVYIAQRKKHFELRPKDLDEVDIPSFIDLLPLEDCDELLRYIRSSKKQDVFRCIIAINDFLDYLGIVDWYNVYTETLPMVNISKFLKSLPE